MDTASSYGTDAQRSLVDMVLPSIYDQVTLDNPLLGIALANAKGKKFGGKLFRVPIMYKESGQGGSYEGLDTFNVNKINTRDAMVFSPKFQYQSVVLENTEVSVSETANNVVDLVMSKIEEESVAMGTALGKILHGDGTGNSSKDMLGLVAGCDDGTTVSTYGGLDRTAGAGTSGDSIKGTLDATAYTTGGTKFSLTALRTLLDSCANGRSSTDLLLTSKEVYNIVEALLPTATLNFSPGNASNISTKPGTIPAMTAYAGYTQIYYRGIPIVKDELMNSTNSNEDYMFALNTSSWIFPLVNMANIEILNMIQKLLKGGIDETNTKMSEWNGFFMTDFKEPVNQGASIAQILFGGNLICTNPRLNGYFTSING